MPPIDRPPATRTSPAIRAHSNGTEKTPRVSRKSISSIATYAPASAMPAPSMPSFGTSHTSTSTFTTSPPSAAGSVRIVTFARPAIVTSSR